jgi:hypothetical protein
MTGLSTRPATTLGSAPSIPATTINAAHSPNRSVSTSSRCSPATPAEEKGNYYEALGHAIDPALVSRTIAIALTDELPTSRASAILGFSVRSAEHPDLVWNFAKAHMKALLAKQDALGINSFAAGLFNFYSDPKDAEVLETYAKANLPPAAAESVAKAVDEIGFRAEFKKRLVPQLKSWMEQANGAAK